MDENTTSPSTLYAPLDPAVRVLIWGVVAAIGIIAIGAALLVVRGLSVLVNDALVLLVLTLVAWTGVLTLRLWRIERRLLEAEARAKHR